MDVFESARLQIELGRGLALNTVVAGESVADRYDRARQTWASGISRASLERSVILDQGDTVFILCSDQNYVWRFLEKNRDRESIFNDDAGVYSANRRVIVNRADGAYCRMDAIHCVAVLMALYGLVAYCEAN